MGQILLTLAKLCQTNTRLVTATSCHTFKQVKQNATYNLAPFFRSALNALSDGMLPFAHCVAPNC